ncbi:hypothetical protein TNCV_4736541 [Trichonephila clavipes]|nr:hypothetical protein TNCV_4736541 [Trichonephila clavipes]
MSPENSALYEPKGGRVWENAGRSLQNVLDGHGSQVVKVTDSWPACHEFEPGTAEDPSYRGAVYNKRSHHYDRSTLQMNGN